MGFLQLDLDDQTTVVIQTVEPQSGDWVPASRGDKVIKGLDEKIRRSVDRIGSLAQVLSASVRKQCQDADEVTVEFGVSLSAEADLALLRGTAEANVKVTVRWKEDG